MNRLRVVFIALLLVACDRGSVDGIPCPKGTSYDERQVQYTIYEEYCARDSVRHGPYRRLDRNDGTQIIEGTCEDGFPLGEWKKYDVDGKVHRIARFDGGLMNGEQLTYHRNGAVERRWHCKSGMPHGAASLSGKGGELKAEGHFTEGTRTSGDDVGADCERLPWGEVEICKTPGG